MSAPRTRPALRRLLTLEAPVAVPDGGGGVRESWEALGALWSDVQAISGIEIVSGEREEVRITHRVIVRGAPEGALSRPRADQRFRDGRRVYGIKAVAEHDPQGRYLICWAEEGAGI